MNRYRQWFKVAAVVATGFALGGLAVKAVLPAPASAYSCSDIRHLSVEELDVPPEDVVFWTDADSTYAVSQGVFTADKADGFFDWLFHEDER